MFRGDESWEIILLQSQSEDCQELLTINRGIETQARIDSEQSSQYMGDNLYAESNSINRQGEPETVFKVYANN